MAYSADSDLIKVRSNILEMGVDNWDTQRTEAERQINRTLSVRWYRSEAEVRGLDWRITPFDPAKASADQLRTLSVYRTLELAYLYLAKEGEDDVFMQTSKEFSKKAADEMDAVLADGLDYDWNDSGVIDDDEKKAVMPRRLVRA